MIFFILRTLLALLSVGFIVWFGYVLLLGVKAFCLRKPLFGRWDP